MEEAQAASQEPQPEKDRTEAVRTALEDPRQGRYLEMLLAKNEVLNLTAARDLEELRVRHLEDSLQLLRLPEVGSAKRLLDLGSGGGFPGIPLAIGLPGAQVTLMDATQKKVKAVQEFIEGLGLANAQAVAGRAEDLAKDPKWRQKFDVVVARALAPLPSLIEYAAPFTKSGGHIVAFKGPGYEAELEASKIALRNLCTRHIRTEDYRMREQLFHLVLFQVTARVPSKYPRGNGLVRKQPLG